MAMLSRLCSGIRKKTLIINLPGSLKGSEECLRIVCPALKHAVHLLKGDKVNVETTHKKMGSNLHHSHSHNQDHHCSVMSSVSQDNVALRPRKSPYPMISVDEALSKVLDQTEILPLEIVNYKGCPIDLLSNINGIKDFLFL